jgi:hypothetical protein
MNSSPKKKGQSALLSDPVKARRSAPSDSSGMPPKVWAWVAEAWIDRDGYEGRPQQKNCLAVFAVSVHEAFPTGPEERLELLVAVGKQFRDRVPAAAPSLWVFPGGYFGFDPRAFHKDPATGWPGFDETVIREALPSVLAAYPADARLAFGADAPLGEKEQQAWVCWRTHEGAVDLHTITRGRTDLPGRILEVGPVRAAFFVCGEFTGSHTEPNGPFCQQQYLDSPGIQLAACRLLIDLAHSRVLGSVNGPPGPRRVHERQMQRFVDHGAAVLAHHHPGMMSNGRPRSDSQSNWIIFRGGRWLPEKGVVSLP